MDDKETLNRRARLRELIRECFDDKIINLIRHIENKSGVTPNQGELSAILKDESGKSFGDKKAKSLAEQIGLHRRWFDMPEGSCINRKEWALDQPITKTETAHVQMIKFNNPSQQSHESEQSPLNEIFNSALADFKNLLIDSAIFKILDVKAACGNGIVNNDYPETVRALVMSPDEARRLIGSANKSDVIKVIVASKDSMIPTIQPDDLLFVDTSVTEYSGEAVYILRHGGELVCKRLSLVGNTLTVSSDNTAYKSWPWSDRHEETAVVGRVLRALPMTFKNFGSYGEIV